SMAGLNSRTRRERKIDTVRSRALGKIALSLLAIFLSPYSAIPSGAFHTTNTLLLRREGLLPYHLYLPAIPRPPISPSPGLPISQSSGLEYLWYEAEDMRGFATQPNGEPVLNPSWRDLPRAQAPGWGMSGTGVSAEWTQGGESGWNSAAASADETRGTIYQDLE